MSFISDKMGGRKLKVPAWVKSNENVFKKGFKKVSGMSTIGKVLGLAATVTAGALAVSSLKKQSKENKKRNKELKTYFGKLPKSDPRYQSLKKGGFV